MPIIVDILTQQFHLSSIDTISKYLVIYSTVLLWCKDISENSTKLVLNKVSRLWKGQPAGKENNETAVYAASLTGTRKNKAEWRHQ